MSGTDIAKAYDPSRVESRWYAEWLKAGAFAGVADPARAPYCIVIPPPNVTGVLTMGHVLNNTLQDILVRRARQEGKGVLWLPGTDHAGLATQTRVEKELRQQGLDRRKMGREKFFQRVVEWRDQHGGIIIEQLKRLGCSCDWSRTVHTLDPAYSRAVLTAFVKLYQRDFIYRGLRMVNWCPASLTALSDEEVISTPQKGTLYHLKYEIVERPGEFLHIATTRPETLMGDTAVAVHPNDPRYQHLQGCHVWRPFPRAAIPIIFDSIVDQDFGSGALKVTPAHDKVDFAIGQRHHLPILDVLNPDGTLNALAGEEFNGVDRFKARKLAAEKLRSLGLLVKEEPYENNVGFSERANVPIEPRLSEQWFLRYPRIEEAKAAVRDGHIKFWPDHWIKVYLNWLDKIQDWCISRQVWWGHRIPVWYRKGLDRAHLTEADYKNPAKVQVSVDGPADPENWEQEEDSLDTWASSWLWPFATLGWPEPDEKQAKELAFWYPTSDLVTGPDIIFFWVARMIVAGLEFMAPEQEQRKTRKEREKENQPLSVPTIQQCIPFKNVYFTGIIRDKQGRKMSKSLGNSPDPVALIEKYGADGLRFGTINSAPQGNDILFDEANVELGRNFCNKLWNAARFRQMQGPTDQNGSLEKIIGRINHSLIDDSDIYVLQKLAGLLFSVQNSLKSYWFNNAAKQLQSFFWGDYCDWYLEVSKLRLLDPAAQVHVLAVQDLCLREFLLSLHPFMPFISEELWHGLGFGADGSFIQNERCGDDEGLLRETKRVGLDLKSEQAQQVAVNENLLRELVSHVRAMKAEQGQAARRDSKLAVEPLAHIKILSGEKLSRLAGLSSVQVLEPGTPAPVGTVARVTPHGTLYLYLDAVDKPAERLRLSKELEKLDQHIAGQEAKLANEAFTSKAPAKVVEGARAQLVENLAKREELRRLLENLK
jgi:valyl-tRNA synthetase